MERDEKSVIILLEKKILKAVLYTWVRGKSGQVRGELESKIIVFNSFKPKWCFCVFNRVLHQLNQTKLLNSSCMWMVWDIICDCRSQLKIKMLKRCLAVWFYFCWFAYQYSFIDFIREMLILYILVNKVSPLAHPDGSMTKIRQLHCSNWLVKNYTHQRSAGFVFPSSSSHSF